MYLSVTSLWSFFSYRGPERCRLGLWYSPRLSYDDSVEYDIAGG